MGLFTHANKHSPVLKWEDVEIEGTGGNFHRGHRTKVPEGWFIAMSNQNDLTSLFIPS